MGDISRINLQDIEYAIKAGSKSDDVESIVKEASAQWGVPEDLIKAMIQAESNWNPKAISKKGAIGLMQLMPSTAAEWGAEDPFDPRQNVMAGTAFLKSLIDKFGSVEKAVAAYNFGPTHVAKGKKYPIETKRHVQKVGAFQKQYQDVPSEEKPSESQEISQYPTEVQRPSIKKRRFGQTAYDLAMAEAGSESGTPDDTAGLLKRQVLNAYTGLKQGLYSEAETINNILDLFTDYGEMPRNELLRTFVKEGQEKIAGEIEAQGDGLVDKVVRGAFSSIPTIIELFAGTPLVAGGLKALKAPQAIKLGSKGITMGKTLLSGKELASAKELAKLGGKSLKGVVPLSEPITFGALGGAKEAVRPGATVGSVLERTAYDVAMGTALPLTRGLPQGIRQAGAAGVGAGIAGLEGGTPEDMAAAGLTMGVLTLAPEGYKGISKLLKGQSTPTKPLPSRIEASDEVKRAGQKHLDSELGKRGYAGHDQWTDYQKRYILSVTPGNVPIPTTFDPKTGSLRLDLGRRYSSEVPKSDPNTRTAAEREGRVTTETIAEDQKGKIQAKDAEPVLGPESMTIEELREGIHYTSDSALKTKLQKEMAKRMAFMKVGPTPAALDEMVSKGVPVSWVAPMTYIKGMLGEGKRVPNALIRDLLSSKRVPQNKLTLFLDYLKGEGYKVGTEVAKTKKSIDIKDVDYVIQDLVGDKKYTPMLSPNINPVDIPTIGNTGIKAKSNILAMKPYIRRIQEALLPSDIRDSIEKWDPKRNEVADTIRLLRRMPRKVVDTFPDLQTDMPGIEKWLDDFLRKRETGKGKWGLGEGIRAVESVEDATIKLEPFENYEGATKAPLPTVMAHDVGHWIVDRLFLKEPRITDKTSAEIRMPYEKYKPEHEAMATLIGQMLLKRAGLPTDPIFGHGRAQVESYLKMIKRAPLQKQALSWINVYRNLQDLGVLKKSKISKSNKAKDVKKFAESYKERAERMIREADEFLEALKEDTSPEVSSDEGVKALRRAEMGTVQKRPVRAGVSTSKIGGGMVAKDVKASEGLPESSEEALDRGKLLTIEQARKIWKEYLIEDSWIRKEVAPENKRVRTKTGDRLWKQALLDQATENQLRREMIESYLGAPKDRSMTREQIENQLEFDRLILQEPTKGFAKEAKEKEETPEGIFKDPSKMSLEELEGSGGYKKRAGTILKLRSKESDTSPKYSPEERKGIINSIVEELKWNRNTLAKFSDASLDAIMKNKVRTDSAKFTTERQQRLTPDVIAEVRVKSEYNPYDIESMRHKAHSMLRWSKWLVDSIDWDRVATLMKEGKLKDMLKPDKTYRVSVEDLAQMESAESPEVDVSLGKSESYKTAPGLGADYGVDKLHLAGAMLRGWSQEQAYRLAELGKALPRLPDELWIGGDKTKGVPRITESEIKSQFEWKLEKVNNGKELPNSLPKEEELRIFTEALAGLNSEVLGDPDMAKIANAFRKVATDKFTQWRNVDPFGKAAKTAFYETWRLFSSSSNEILAKKFGIEREYLGKDYESKRDTFLSEIKEILAETPEEGADLAFKDLDESQFDSFVEVERRLKHFASPEDDALRAQKEALMTPIDHALAEAGKQKEVIGEYRSITEKMKALGDRGNTLRSEILKTMDERDTASGEANKESLESKVKTLREEEGQLRADWMYLNNIRNMYTRRGAPFTTGKESFIEMPLRMEEHGIDGTIMSQGHKGGASFSIIQGPNGTPAVPGEPGHSMYAKADVSTARTKGKIMSWEVPKDIDPRVEDALYNSILERYTMREKPIAITNEKGVADEVRARRVDHKYKVYTKGEEDPILAWLPEDSQQARELREQKTKELREVAELWDKKVSLGELKEGEKALTSRELKNQWLRRAVSLSDGTFDYDLRILRETPGELGLSDTSVQRLVEYMPLIDMISDPTQSRILPVARVGNLAQQAEYSINNYITQYVKQAEYYLKPYRANAEMKQKIMRHLHWKNANKPEWKSTDPKVVEAATGYRMIMEDLANLFDLKKKGIYREDYATISYDMGELWNNYAKKLGVVDKLADLPDNLLAKIDPKDFNYLNGIAKKNIPWDKLGDVDQAQIMDKFFKWNVAYDRWEALPDVLKNRIPKQKFISYFQHRDAKSLADFALNEDIWDVTMRYIHTVVHDGIMNDFFLPKAKNVAKMYKYSSALGANEMTTVRGYLDNYIKQVAGFGKNSQARNFMNDVFKQINTWFSKPILPEAGGMEGAANLYQSWLYRGALGVDTAVRNLTQSIYTVADLGGYNWVKGLGNYVYNMAAGTEKYKRFSERQKLLEEFFGTRLEMFKKGNPSKLNTIADWDRRVTALALSPMRVTEHINRGIAYFAGLAEAAKQGLPFEQGHVVGYKGASTLAHPLKMSEMEWFATQKMYKSQFGYGKTHTSPLLQGAAMRFFTPFWSFPIKSLQFVSNLGKESFGIERWGQAPTKEATEAFLTSGKGAMARFLALTGFLATAPQILASTLGIDAGYLWGKGLFPNQFTPMWMGMLEDLYVGVFGGMGMSVPPSDRDKSEAFKRLSNSLITLTIPMGRFGSKANKVLENMEKGYYAMGPSELPAVETTFAKEVVNLFGFPPMTRDAKKVVWESYRDKGNVLFKKQDALKKASKYWEKKDYKSAATVINKLYRDTGISLDIEDINDFQRRQNTTTAYEEAEKHLLKERKELWSQKLREAQRKNLPKGAGKRSLWVNTSPWFQEEEENEEESQIGLSGLIGGQ